MSQTKTKRLIIKAVKEWCAENGHVYVRYEHGASGHDTVHVKVWDIPIKSKVMSTPKSGPQTAANSAVRRLNTKVVRLRQKIIDGRYRRKRK